MSTSDRLALGRGPEPPEITAPPAPPVITQGDMRPRKRIVLPDNDPQGLCPKCGGENIDFAYHGKGIQYLSRPAFPCYHYEVNAYSLGIEPIGEHICKSCATCGFPWMESVARAGPEYRVVAVEEGDLYDDSDDDGGDMSIRKTGSATGELLGIEDDTALAKEASAESPWGDPDEKALEAENDDADRAE